MDDQEQFVIEHQHDALADAANRAHHGTVDRLEGRIHRSQDERTTQRDTLEAAADDPLGERFDVNGYVRKFGHGGEIPVYFRPSWVLPRQNVRRRASMAAEMPAW